MDIAAYNPHEFEDDDMVILEGIGRMFGFTFFLPPFGESIKNPFYYIDRYSDKDKYNKLLETLHNAGYYFKPLTIRKKKYLEIFKNEDDAANVG